MDKAVILEALVKADLIFQSKLSAPELTELSALWSEALDGMDEADFVLGMRRWAKVGEFFPRPAQIIEAVDEAHAEAHRAKLANAAPLAALPVGSRTPEEIENFRAKCRDLRAMVARNCSPAQPFRQRRSTELATQ